MRLKKLFVSIVGGLGIGAGAMSGSAFASDDLQACDVNQPISSQSFSDRTREAECACDAALEAGTIEALEEFLEEYGWADSECRTRALNRLAMFEPNIDDRSTDNSPPHGYGG